VTLAALALRRSDAQSIAIRRNRPFWAFIGFVLWIALQSFWALDKEAHLELRDIYVKFIFVIVMVVKCIETDEHLRHFLWAHVLGCFYLGWLAFTSYAGGRLDGVGGPGIDESNAAALQMVTGILIAASLFLVSSRNARIALFVVIPIMVNGLVTTISRSGFLAAAVGGLAYIAFAPQRHRWTIRVLSVLAVVLFVMLTNQTYWDRIATIKHGGEQIEGVDTGGGRLEIVAAQWRMFQGRPFGCGHMCTTVLSPSYIDASLLSGGARASHNTFMTMLVDHGIVGVTFYVAMLVWLVRSLLVMRQRVAGRSDFSSLVLPAIAGVVFAITVGDMFAQYPKFEARIWFVSVVLVLLHFTERSATGKR